MRCFVFIAEHTYLQLLLHSMGKITITLAVNLCFMFPVEVLPTVARSQAAGVIHTLGFMVAFVSPYIVYLVSRTLSEILTFMQRVCIP